MAEEILFVPSRNVIIMKVAYKGKPLDFVNEGVMKMTLFFNSVSDPTQEFVIDSTMSGSPIDYSLPGELVLNLGTQAIPAGFYDVTIKIYGLNDNIGQVVAHPELSKSNLQIQSVSVA